LSNGREPVSKAPEASKISKSQLIGDFKRIGVKEGDCLGVALSLRSVGRVVGGPDAFIDALLDILGPEGTLMMNCYTRFYQVSQIKSHLEGQTFDYRSTPAWTGLVSETFRKRPGTIRSRHPLSSIAASGRMANYLTKGHDETARSYLPYSRLANINGKMLYIGLGNDLVSMRHEAQSLAGLMDIVPLEVGINYLDDNGELKLFISKDTYACIKKLKDFVPIIKDLGLAKEGPIGNAPSMLLPVRGTLDAMTKLLKDDPTLNLCDNVTCIWCRELERRLNLYNRIRNPALFQRNKMVINLIALVNKHRLRGKHRGAYPIFKTIELLDKVL
jgi:aminoglycoside 3-N-acetyltransferase